MKAQKVYYEGRCDLRAHAKKAETPYIQWSRTMMVGDWILKWLVGYGVKTWRLMILIIFFISLGTGVFWHKDALFDTKTSKQVSEQSIQEKVFNRLAYTLDLFIPVLDFGIAKKLQRKGLGREIYGVIHIIAGWLLIPLLIASLSGIVRRQW